VAILVRHQMHGNLGVGVTGEFHSRGLQLPAQNGVVLDDAVVDHGHFAGRVAVRVRVTVGRAPVGGPAGMAQPGVTG
jgi:hypothetical protein